MNSSSETILIVGTGALACLFAARFAAAGLPVTMLGNWLEGVNSLRDQGVRLIDTNGSEITYPVRVIDLIDNRQRFFNALVLVKSWQTERSAKQLMDYLLPNGNVLTLQNGLGNREVLVRYFGEGNVFTGVTTNGATLLGPGLVKSGGSGTISLSDNLTLSLFVGWFQYAGFTVQVVPDMDGIIWGKLVANAAINPVTALLGILNGELLHSHSARVLLTKVALEVASIAIGKGIQLPFADPIYEVEEIARKTAENRSSMLQDFQRGAPTEIDAICGSIIRTGTELGIPTPLNETLYHLVKASVENKNKV
jgi:2-dehydropantoate 2-reductase